MKSCVSIALAMLCLSSSAISHANARLVEEAGARSRAGDHAGALALYHEAYELDRVPEVLVQIARAHRQSGATRDALTFFCKYIYIAPAGELADEASSSARAIAAQLGKPTDSDREACATEAAPARRTAVALDEGGDVDTIAAALVPPAPPRITKREIGGLVALGGALTSMGLAYRETREIAVIRHELAARGPGTDVEALVARDDAAQLRFKMFLGLGGVALVTGGILYATGRADRKRAERAYLAPSVTKHGGGVVFGGRF
jgi:hypothetical protein